MSGGDAMRHGPGPWHLSSARDYPRKVSLVQENPKKTPRIVYQYRDYSGKQDEH